MSKFSIIHFSSVPREIQLPNPGLSEAELKGGMGVGFLCAAHQHSNAQYTPGKELPSVSNGGAETQRKETPRPHITWTQQQFGLPPT